MSINFPPVFTYISPDLLATFRREADRFFLHTYTRIPKLGTGSLDEWGQPTYDLDTPVSGVPCFYLEAEGIITATREGLGTLNLPTLFCRSVDPIREGDHVNNVLDADGRILLTGLIIVEQVTAKDPNTGGAVWIEAQLRQVLNTSNT